MNVFLVVLFGVVTLFSQGLVMRNHIANPFAVESKTGLLTRTLYSAEANRGFGSEGQEHYWNLKFNAVIEFYSWEKSKLVLVGSNELTANPYSDIKFNPRSSNWNERIMYFVNHGPVVSEWGVTHQCKHDIDNQDSLSYPGNNRVIILTSLHGGVTWPLVDILPNLDITTHVRYHNYIIAYDHNAPDTIRVTDWSNIEHSVIVALRASYEVMTDVALFSNNWVNPVLFTEGTDTQFNYHLEAGVSLLGHGSNFDIYYGYEHYFDDVMNPWSQESQAFYIGIRIRDTML